MAIIHWNIFLFFLSKNCQMLSKCPVQHVWNRPLLIRLLLTGIFYLKAFNTKAKEPSWNLNHEFEAVDIFWNLNELIIKWSNELPKLTGKSYTTKEIF